MNIKIDFITNSSSASFTIAKKDLTEIQILMIKDHIEVGYALVKIIGELDLGWADQWRIEDTGDEICGHTTMDNFDMYSFLSAIGVPSGVIKYESHC